EFGSSVLQLLRQPMELGSVSLARAGGTIVFPSHFMLVAAANPCACGYYGDAQISCTCTPAEVMRYQNRIGGPLMDRFDLVVDVWRSDPAQVLATGTGTSSRQLRDGVLAALEFKRSREEPSEPCGSGEALLGACKLGARERAYLEALAQKHQLSGRGIMRSLSVARTIADLDQEPAVQKEHLFEAVNYRAKSGEGS
ncbi:MAG: ATP-binding protein, partial [Coriobacteriales bacterium]|nr:ATP-binding protein [Coriobacteriales bacterium]